MNFLKKLDCHKLNLVINPCCEKILRIKNKFLKKNICYTESKKICYHPLAQLVFKVACWFLFRETLLSNKCNFIHWWGMTNDGENAKFWVGA